jgi:hypothetical protein
LAKLFSLTNIKDSILIMNIVLLIIYWFYNNKICGLIGFLCLGLVQSYDFYTKYKNTGNIPWLDILYIFVSIFAVINLLISIF